MSNYTAQLLGIYSESTSVAPAQWLKKLSKSLDLPIVCQPPSDYPSGYFIVVVSLSGLCLHFTGKKAPNPIIVDFTQGSTAHRRFYGGGKGQLIAKAVGAKSGFKPRILDLTAGLGQDAFVFATLGCDVTMLERVSLIHALLADALQRAQRSDDDELLTIINRMSLHFTESKSYLEGMDTAVDVIYFDPMFPDRGKSAKAKKSMVAFHALVGQDLDAGEVLKTALKKARYRVVVKRPRKSPSLDQQYPHSFLPRPGFVLSGKSSRFDVYPLSSLP